MLKRTENILINTIVNYFVKEIHSYWMIFLTNNEKGSFTELTCMHAELTRWKFENETNWPLAKNDRHYYPDSPLVFNSIYNYIPLSNRIFDHADNRKLIT